MDMTIMPQMMYSINMNGTIIHTVIDPSILDQFWANLAIQVWPGNELVAISGLTFRILDDGGKHYIAHNFASILGEAMVKYVIDGSGTHPDRIFLGRASFFRPENIVTNTGDLDVWVPAGLPLEHLSSPTSGTSGSVKSQPAATGGRRPPRGGAVKVPRPPNAYILYRRDRHKAIKDLNPDISNNEISVILGRQWNEETDEIRDHYHMLSNEIKRQVEERHPHYKYNPRKSSEIRRRARGNRGVYNVQNEATSLDSPEKQDQSAQMDFPAIESIPTPPMDIDTSFDTSILDSFMSLSQR